MYLYKSIWPEVFCKKAAPKIFTKGSTCYEVSFKWYFKPAVNFYIFTISYIRVEGFSLTDLLEILNMNEFLKMKFLTTDVIQWWQHLKALEKSRKRKEGEGGGR